MNKSYKIWIILFVIINLLLLIWSMGYLKFLEEKFIAQDKVLVIKPDNNFNKTPPPKDESFPNEKSKIWGAFENKVKEEEVLENNKEVKDAFKNKDSKSENNIESENKSVDNIQTDTQSPETEQISEKKNKFEEKKPHSKIKSNEDQIQNELKNIDSLEENNAIELVFFYVQVASLSKENLVEIEWNRFKKKNSDYLANLIYIPQKTILNDNRVFYRLLVGKFKSKKEANNFCNKLTLSKCIIRKINE